MKKILLTTLLVIISFNGCSSEEKGKEQAVQAQQKVPALPVQVFTINDEQSAITKIYSGLITPYEEVDVIARVSGVLEKKHFKEGSFVKKGQLLYTIEQDTYNAELQKAKADVSKAKARFNKAKKDYDRANSLIEAKAISKQQYDQYIYDFEDAKASLEFAKAAQFQAQLNYDYTAIKAPIEGIVGIQNVNVGDLVGTSSENLNLVNITSINPVYVEFSLTKNDMSRYLSHLRSDAIKVSLNKGAKIYDNGVIDYIAATVESDTDTLPIRAKFDNPTHELVAGEFTQVQLSNIILKDVHIIPEVALLKTKNGNFVYVVKDDIAKMTPVSVGELTANGVVIEKGLAKNDKVVTSNIAKLRPDTNVQILNKE